MTLESVNPTTGEILATYPEMTASEVEQIIADCHDAHSKWRGSSFDVRSEHLRRAAGLLRQRRDALAELMTREMGKPVVQARAEVDKCAWVCDYYAENAESF